MTKKLWEVLALSIISMVVMAYHRRLHQIIDIKLCSSLYINYVFIKAVKNKII